MDEVCKGCGALLTGEEQLYYGDSCNECQQKWSDDINRWRAGEENEEFDKRFSAPKPTCH